MLAAAADSLDDGALRLRRALTLARAGDRRGVIQVLEPIDFAGPAFPGADRAAFLLGHAYRRLGDHDRFARLAREAGAWPRQTPYTRWLEAERLMDESRGPGAPGDTASAAPAGGDARLGLVVADALAADLLLRAGDSGTALARLAGGGEGPAAALVAYLEARALAAAGRDDAEALARLAAADTASVLGRDLAGAAILRLAARALERGEDPRALLQAVPAGGRHAAHALHLASVIALERGEVAEAERLLDSLRAVAPGYAGRREAALARAGIDLDGTRWEEAHAAYAAIEREWAAERDRLTARLADPNLADLWSEWERDPLATFLVLDRGAAEAELDRLALAATDLTGETPPVDSTLAPASPSRGAGSGVAPPPPEDWAAVDSSARAVAQVREEAGRTRAAAADEAAARAERRRYLDTGAERVRAEQRTLEQRAAHLDSLRRMLDQLDAHLRAVRDEASRRLVVRARHILNTCANHLLWVNGMRLFHIDGPNRARPSRLPLGVPSPESLLVEEEALTRALAAMVEQLALSAPELIARSYERAWRPRLIDRVADQADSAGRALAWSRAIAGTLDSTIAGLAESERERALLAAAEALDHRGDSLAAAHREFQASLARVAVERALLRLEVEREAIAYGLAVSAYGRAVRIGATDSAATAALADTAGGEPAEDPATTEWRARATGALNAFLADHDSSKARGEMRFRLADLLLVQARHDFRAGMDRYVRAQSAGGPPAPLPLLDSGPALALYQKILEEDRDFERRDAVLFNAAMILADAGSPEAERWFAELVAEFPQSPYVQESLLRMGDLRFNEKQYAECVPLYERAAAGSDPSLSAMAHYKLGWAHFNQDHHAEAAAAFGVVLDLYASERAAEIRVDLDEEAEAYLVHSLARAGGAAAFTRHFDRAGERPYTLGVLMALGQHFRRFTQYADAVACDELAIERYPQRPEALVAARRLVETRQRGAEQSQVRAAQRKHAPHFAPKSAWSEAQASDSVRADGAEFARTSWLALAYHHHNAARDRGDAADWREARGFYRTLLSHWPEDEEAATFQLHAGEASAELAEHEAALAHYAAAAGGPDSVAAVALYQSVAVNDAWYESTRGAGGNALGQDSLARAVMAAANRLLERFPAHEQAADLRWRQGNLGFAHGWYEQAAEDLGRMVTSHPADPRTPFAAGLRADAYFKRERYEDAGAAYELTLALAKSAGYDSLERHATGAVPICYHRHAEAAVAADSTAYRRHADLFERIAARFPNYEHAHATQYRAGLAFRKAGQHREAVRAWRTLIRAYPKSEYVRDAYLQIPAAFKEAGEESEAAVAYMEFVRAYPEDPNAREAWLQAADLFDEDGADQRALDLRLEYLRAFPDDVETAAEILEPLARRDLAQVGPDQPISHFLGDSADSKRGPDGPSHLAAFLRLVARNPKLAVPGIQAEVLFQRGEEEFTAYSELSLTLPLDKSIAAKQKQLDRVLARYKKCVEQGVATWAHASTFRIGAALAGFGEALERSEVPADLEGDDRTAYEDVLMEKSQVFYDRAEGVWTDLLRKKQSEAPDDPWIAKARESLWTRLGGRFFGRPELAYPLISARAPEKAGKAGEDSAQSSASTSANAERAK